MSEAPTFNPMQEAQARADTGRQVFEQYMERDAVTTGVEDHAQGYKDMADYLGSRPSQDAKGKLHDPETGAFMSKEDAGKAYSNAEVTEHDEYAEMTPMQLAKLSAEAEVRGDKTMQSSIDDALQEKILAMPVGDEVTSSDGTSRKSERENVLDRVLNAREAHIKTLTGATPEVSEENAPIEGVEENAPVEEVSEGVEENAPIEEAAEEQDDVELAETEVVEKPAKAATPVANPFDTAPTTAPVAGMEAPVKAEESEEPAQSEAVAEATGFAAPVNEKLAALGDAETGPILAEELTPQQLIAIANQERTPENSKRIDFANAEMERRLKDGEPLGDDAQPSSSTAIELFKSKDVAQIVDTPEKKRRFSKARVIGAALVAGVLGGLWFAGMDEDRPKDVPAVEVEATADNPFSGDSAETPQDTRTADRAAREAGESVEAPAAPEHVFTVEVPYTEGAPTAWSWAEGLGVKDIPGFLKEVMGDDWRDIARNMKVGDTLSVSDEEIAQFSK